MNTVGHMLPWLWIGSSLHVLAVAWVVIHCLGHRREAASTVLWIFVAWSVPFFGALAFSAFGVNRMEAKGWRRRTSAQRFLKEREDAAMPLAYWRSLYAARAGEPSSDAAREINHMLNAVLPDNPLLEGNTVEPLVTGDQAYPRMLEAIERAAHHIHLQTFIIGDDAIGRQFMDRLKRKAETGVTVRFMFDRFGSTQAWLRGLFRRYRHTPGMEVVGWTQANPIKRQFQLNLRNHSKVMVVDGKEAFLGGINLHQENVTRGGRNPIQDYHFAVTGPVVQELQYSFLKDWYFMTDEDPQRLLSKTYFPEVESAGKALARVINAGPSHAGPIMTDVFFAAISAARKQVLVVTPYFVPTTDILRALRCAALRGVDVRLVTPLKNNHVYAGIAGRALYDDLLSSGVRVFERPPPFMHAKALIVDETVAIVGTANLDVRSLQLNYETNLAVYDEGFVSVLKRIVLDELAVSTEIHLVAWRRRSLPEQWAENFFNLLTPVL